MRRGSRIWSAIIPGGCLLTQAARAIASRKLAGETSTRHRLPSSSEPLRRAPTARAILNQVVQYSQIDRTLAALADPTRRSVLERVGRGSATITELAEPFGISLTGMKKHVKVLEDAELVTTEKVGRTRRCSLGPRRLEDVHEWMEMYRRMLDGRLDRFGELIDNRKEVHSDQ